VLDEPVHRPPKTSPTATLMDAAIIAATLINYRGNSIMDMVASCAPPPERRVRAAGLNVALAASGNVAGAAAAPHAHPSTCSGGYH